MPVGNEKYCHEKERLKNVKKKKRCRNWFESNRFCADNPKEGEREEGVSHEMAREAKGRERNRKIWENESEREREGGRER